MSNLGYFLLFLIIVIPLAAVAYIFYTRIQAQRAGRQPPPFSSFVPFRSQRRQPQGYSASSSSAGVFGTIRAKFHSLTGSGSQRSGAYEQPLGSNRARGLDPDGAWDARVGDEADAYGSGGYYEEQELGLRSGGGRGTELPEYGDEEMGRGRSISRDGPSGGGGFIGGDQRGLDQRYDQVTGGENPFGDHAERSELRGVSPRPAGGKNGDRQQGSGGVEGDSPTERRSMFHENM
ncbi:MAG: hypothetical protein LQ338_000862 [Usnochroma carphineum]|nr:MAG: hypothetical protein LQ338_000862 [Usnochroma carphineum]